MSFACSSQSSLIDNVNEIVLQPGENVQSKPLPVSTSVTDTAQGNAENSNTETVADVPPTEAEGTCFAYTWPFSIEIPLYDLSSIVTVAFFDCTNNNNLVGKMKMRATSFVDGHKRLIRAGAWKVFEAPLSGIEDLELGGVVEAQVEVKIDPLIPALTNYFVTVTPKRNFEVRRRNSSM